MSVGDIKVRRCRGTWEAVVHVPRKDRYGDWSSSDYAERHAFAWTRRGVVRRAQRVLRRAENRRDRDRGLGRYAWIPAGDGDS